MPLKLYSFKGCHSCPLSRNGDRCKDQAWFPVRVKFKVPQFIIIKGREVPVFKKGHEIDAKAVIKNGVVYCCRAYSTCIQDFEDFISLRSVSISIPKTSISTRDYNVIRRNNPMGPGPLGM